jgi:hypothetical protein
MSPCIYPQEEMDNMCGQTKDRENRESAQIPNEVTKEGLKKRC